MFECDLQDIAKVSLFSSRPTPHRHRQQGKLDNHRTLNYTMKLQLSLIVTTRYAADPHCQKPLFPAPRKLLRDRRGEDPEEYGQTQFPRSFLSVDARPAGTHNHSNHLCHSGRKHSGQGLHYFRIDAARARCSFFVRIRFWRGESVLPAGPVDRSKVLRVLLRCRDPAAYPLTVAEFCSSA